MKTTGENEIGRPSLPGSENIRQGMEHRNFDEINAYDRNRWLLGVEIQVYLCITQYEIICNHAHSQ